MKIISRDKMLRKSISTSVILIFLSLVLGILDTANAQGSYDPTVQTPALLYDEARTVYLGNLARRDNGVPPLRWNRQLTHAARWFSWDSVENRPGSYCGHEDTLGGGFWNRAATWGYLGWVGAENAFCGYGTPQDAINGWMNSPGHRANLLNAAFREVGLGYYRRISDGRGYIAQVFGGDYVYAPAIIENEAVSTTNPSVNLYIYDRDTTGGFISHGAATQMMVSNNPYFQGAAWEPYNPNKAWTLTGGTGWRNVYVRTRDRFNRTMTVSDTIYLGATVPLNELGSSQMSTRQTQVTLYNLNGGALPQVQFSPGWLADDTHGSFNLLWGNGERVNDAAAWGGTAFRLRPGNGESFAWVDDWKFPVKDISLVAYFRLKVSDNTSPSDVGRISVDGGGTEYGPLFLQGTDFNAPNQYQEFAIHFTHNTNPNNVFLTFQFWRSGSADVYVDAVSIFSAPQAITSPLTWSVPGNNYRGQGVWVRYTNGGQFSDILDGVTIPYTISGNTGVGGATLSYNDGTDKTVVANGSGNYSIKVPYGWSGTVTPSHPCFIFTPESRVYNNVTDSVTNQNYTAITSCVSSTFLSSGLYDGWILESSETSNQGSTMNTTATLLYVGDNSQDKQYKSILSFNTSNLPDNSVITKIQLKIRHNGFAGTNMYLPAKTHANLVVDIRKRYFGTSLSLLAADFQAGASKNAVGTLASAPTPGWYTITLNATSFPFVNLIGTTQFRMRFQKDDNDDLQADYLKIFSGNGATAANRPLLIIEYYVP